MRQWQLILKDLRREDSKNAHELLLEVVLLVPDALGQQQRLAFVDAQISPSGGFSSAKTPAKC
jgi:hypothetical protein